MSDIVERLRTVAQDMRECDDRDADLDCADLHEESADEIERLRVDLARAQSLALAERR